MRTGRSGRIAWSMCGLTVLLGVADAILALVNRSTTSADSLGLPGQVAVLGVTVAVLGALIASRFPDNSVGWLFSVIGLGLAASIFAQDYAILALGFDPATLGSHMITFVLFAFAGIPIAAGAAILKHRLYDVDVIINRTLVYGALSASLGLAYYASIVLLQTAVSDQFADSQMVVAGSTLAVAVLFRPLRSRIQEQVDRRFNRRKYDAEKIIEGFSSKLREEVDLDRLSRYLVDAVEETMEPRRVSLWLRPSLPGELSTPRQTGSRA